MTDAQAPAVLVLGLGNVLCGDDGLGIVALERLRARYELPENVSLVDGGTLGLSLLPTLEEADCVWILDAVTADAPPGTLVAIEGERVEPALRERLSPHQVGVADLLDALHWRDTMPESLRVLGLVPETLGLEIALSPHVAAHLDELVEAAARELIEAGHAVTPRHPVPDEALVDRRRDPLVGALGL
jgi:hydrogenase maturation protease